MTAPAQGAAQTAQLPSLDDPGAVGGVRPRIADLRNRTVIVQPLSIARNVPGVQPGSLQDRITANIFVLDGGPLEFGGKPEKFVPHTLVAPTPFLAEGMYISQTNMVQALTASLPGPGKPQGGLVVGVITQGRANNPQHNPPWNIVALEAGDPRRQLAANLLQQFFTGQFRNPEPQQTGAPTPPGGALAYTHAVTMPHTAAGQPVPNYAEIAPPTPPHVLAAQSQVAADYARMQGHPDPAYQAFLAQQAAAAQAAQAAPAAPPVDPAYAAWLASQQQPQAAPAAPVASAPPANVAPTGPGGFYMPGQGAPVAPAAAVPPPPGWSADVWAQLSEQQRAGILASQAPAAAASASATPPFSALLAPRIAQRPPAQTRGASRCCSGVVLALVVGALVARRGILGRGGVRRLVLGAAGGVGLAVRLVVAVSGGDVRAALLDVREVDCGGLDDV